MSEILIFVNGKKIAVQNPDPETTLLAYIRETLRLTGSKVGCGEGGCGVCTVMVSSWDDGNKKVEHKSINACLAPLVLFDRCAITTIEGIGNTNKLHVIQDRLAMFHGTQCGFCTPGIVMSMYTLLRNCPGPTTKQIDDYLQGNLCRCTGYRPILAAFQTFSDSKPTANLCAMGDKCCKVVGNNSNADKTKEESSELFKPFDPTQEPIFPSELKIMCSDHKVKHVKTFTGERTTWHVPTNMKELLEIKVNHPLSQLVGGNTEIGIETTLKGKRFTDLICPKNVVEMNGFTITKKGVKIGSACTLTSVQHKLKEIIKRKPAHETQVLSAVVEMLQWFGGEQIRNVATIGGNVMTASPISDIIPILCASSAILQFTHIENGLLGFRSLRADNDFFTGYRKTSASNNEILTSVTLPFTSKNSIYKFYKQSKRQDDDIAIVNAAFNAAVDDQRNVTSLVASYGGVAAKVVVLSYDLHNGQRRCDKEFCDEVLKRLSNDISISGDAPGGMVEYRRTLMQSLFFKFFIFMQSMKDGKMKENVLDLRNDNNVINSTQVWQKQPVEKGSLDKVGSPMMHVSATKQITGEAKFTDDIDKIEGELYMALVLSTYAHAKIVSVDTEQASLVPGFVAYVDRKDVPGSNIVWRGDTVFADGEVTCVGHIIGAVVADTEVHARRAVNLVKVEYDEIKPVIITIEDAIEHSSYFEPVEKKAVHGNVERGFEESDYVLTGESRSSGQDHFYLENHSCIVIPKYEDDEMDIIVSSQNLMICQMSVAACLGVAANKIMPRIKRLGGAFGGKESRSFLLPVCAAVASKKCKRPVRCVLNRHEDMQITGMRHPFHTKYKIGFNKDGNILALDVTTYTNGGNTVDLSHVGLNKFMLGAQNAYCIPNVSIQGFVCKTNTTSTTCFRGFGVPQALFSAETWISHVASHLNMTEEQVREINMIKEGDVSHYNQKYEDINIRRCWQYAKEHFHFDERKTEIVEFNATNRYKKRGVSCTPVVFGVGFPTFMNQAGAMVSIYTDGSVIISHGGVEMGQGLHTKMIQIASKVLQTESTKIHISETNLAIIPNTSPTAGSISSDLYGMAVKSACEELVSKLEPIRSENPDWTWEQVIGTAYMQRIPLFSTGFYKTPEINTDAWNLATGEIHGKSYVYHISGAAVSQVEVDCLTGHHVVLETNIVMDIGRSLNPAVDIGQIEGAFVQGYGMMTLEDPFHDPSNGRILNTGAGAYKIPCFSDIPRKFNVHILPDTKNDKAIYSSKAVGEPPLLLASSVFFAIKNAIACARADDGLTGYFYLGCPASAELIRMACVDEFTKTSYEKNDGLPPWSFRL